MHKKLKILTKFIGVIILAMILYKTNWQELGEVFANIDFFKLAAIYLLLIPSLFFCHCVNLPANKGNRL